MNRSESSIEKLRQRLRWLFASIGPGIAIAATGVGAGDLVSVTAAGSKFGNTLIWAVVVGAILKYVLNEGVARWQLATGQSVVEGWAQHLGPLAGYCFVAYLVLWTFFVSGGLMVAAGLAAHTLIPILSRQWWGVIHAVLGFVLVWLGTYERFEQVMKALVALMFIAIVGTALAAGPSADSLLVPPAVPVGGLPFTLGLIGGVGGTVTMLAYGYWIQERNWIGVGWLGTVRTDLAIAYGLTGLFGVGVMFLSTEILYQQGIQVEGQDGLLRMASILQQSLGPIGQWLFLIGFWGATFSSILGVFQGVPYLFADFVCQASGSTNARDEYVNPRKPFYRMYLLFMAFPCMLMLFAPRPIWIVVTYAAISSLFLPLLALSLLILNNRTRLVGRQHRNGPLTNLLLLAAIGLFIYLGIDALISRG